MTLTAATREEVAACQDPRSSIARLKKNKKIE